MVFPAQQASPIITIHPYSIDSLGPTIQGLNLGGMSNASSSTWPTANKAILVPFVVSSPSTIVKLFCHNGAAVSGNMDIGIYDYTGRLLVSSGSTAQAGTNAIQEFDITDTRIGSGMFYIALAVDNTTATIFRVSATNARNTKFLGMAEVTSAVPLPASATLATTSVINIPIIGLTLRTVI